MEFTLLISAAALVIGGVSIRYNLRSIRDSRRAREGIVALEARACERFLADRAACAAAGDLSGALRSARLAAQCSAQAFHVARFGFGSTCKVLA